MNTRSRAAARANNPEVPDPIRPNSQHSNLSSVPLHGFYQSQPNQLLTPERVETVNSQDSTRRSTTSRAETLFPEGQAIQSRGGHHTSTITTPPTPFVDSNGDVQGLFPSPSEENGSPQSQVQSDEISGITGPPPDNRLDIAHALGSIDQCLKLLLARSDHLDPREPSTPQNNSTVTFEEPTPMANPRQPIDLPLKEVSYRNATMTNPPVLLQPGDQPFWKYGNDLMRSTEIIETTLPTVLRRQPIYHIRCANGQEHDVRHDELYIPKSDALNLNKDGVIKSSGSILSASDQLDLHAIDGPHPDHLSTIWVNLDPSKFKLHNLKTHLKDYALKDDSIVSIVNAYEFISQAITAASTTGVVKLPDIGELSPQITIRDLLMPPPSYPRYTTAKSCYQNIASSLSILFNSKEFSATAPKTRLSLLSIRSQDGIEQLNHILRTRIPTLGATDFHAYKTIMELKAQDKTLLINFIQQAKDIDLQLSFSAHPLEDNTLFGHFLKELMQTNLHSFVSHVFAAFNKFLKRHGSKKKYEDDTIDTVSQDLLDSDAPSTIIRLDTLNDSQDVNNPRPYRERMAKKNARSAIQRLKFASLSTSPQEDVESPIQPDDSSVDDDTTDLTDEEMNQASTQANMFYSAIVEDDSYKGDKEELYSNLVFKAMEHVKKSRVPCDVCDSITHTGATCGFRGKEFQPEWLQKRVAQKNLIDGATPKVPIPQRTPPPRASFSKIKPQFKAMSINDPSIESELDVIQAQIDVDTGSFISPQLASIALNPIDEADENVPTVEDISFHDQQVNFH